MHSVEILGVRVDDVTMAETVAYVGQCLGEPAAPCRQIATVNPEFVMTARRQPDFASVLAASDLNLPDGANGVRAARLLGRPLRERVAGSDLIWRLAERGAECGWRVFMLGAGEGVAAQAAAKLCARYPALRIVGVWSGSPAASEQDSLVARVNASEAQLLWVAYGAPAQDLWIARNRARLKVQVAMGVGGSFDFVAGRLPRAPAWMQQAGLEWLFRLGLQPWRIRRQLVLAKFAGLIFLEWAKQKSRR